MRLRLRAPGGQSAITLSDDATVGDLISEIREKTSIHSFEVKYGYPPKPLRLSESELSRPLSEIDVNLDNESLIISAKDDATTSTGSTGSKPASGQAADAGKDASIPTASFSFTDLPGTPKSPKLAGPISLKKQTMEGDVPELPLLDRGATMGISSRLCGHG